MIDWKRYGVLFILVLVFQSMILAQTPVLKVDLNISSRNESEVNEPGYIPWPINSSSNTKTIEGVTFEFKNGTIEDTYYKTAVQAPYYARLANDGFVTTRIELHISGLKSGTHSLVTFHNATSNPDNNTYSPIDIYMKRVAILTGIMETNRVLSNDLATTAYFEFEAIENETVVISFVPQAEGIPFMINGFHLNSSDPKKLAKLEYPKDKDEHVDIDSDTLVLSWKSPENTVSHNFYFGKDETKVLLATPDSIEFVGNLADTFYTKTGFYNIDNYYWRIDPIDASGDTTKGDVWYFKKRHQAFPEAEGYGKYAIGGRGGSVVYVTNLNADGPGSFKHAVDNATGPTTILFTVSGLITLEERLVIRNDYITVAGQSAPGKGVCFRWAPIGVTGDDLIVQNLRMRLGYGKTFDGMGLTGAQNSIIDHCSVSWTIDEAVSSRGAKNITLQRTLIAEALNQADHSNYGSGAEHGYAASIGGDVGSFHHNLLAHCEGRNWSLAGGLDGDGYYAGRLDIFNNVVYNWGKRATDGGAHEVNFVGNYYKKGAACTQHTILRAQLEGTGQGSQSYYYHNNIVENTDGSFSCDGTNDACSRQYELSGGQVLDWTVWVSKPFFPSQATIHSAKEAYKHVLSDVGATQPCLDDHDVRMIDETLNGTYSLRGSKTGKPGLPDREGDAGGWEVYPGYVRSADWDSDLDGLPNWWENAKGLNPESVVGDFSESNADEDKNGYTNLEEYLQWMDRPHYFIGDDDTVTIDLSQYTRGFQKSPVYEVLSDSNGIAKLHQDTTLITFTPSSEGICGFEFKVTDAEGASKIQNIGIYKGQMESDSLFTYSYYLDRGSLKKVIVDSVNTIIYLPASVNVTSKDGITNINIAETLELTATVLPENAINKEVEWTSSDTTIATVSNNGLLLAKSNGEVTISAVALENNKKGSITITVGEVTSINNTIISDIQVYPNPVDEDLNIQFNSSVPTEAEVNVLDLSGRVVYSEMIWANENVNHISIDISGHLKGIYFLSIKSSDNNYITRYVKK